MSSRRGKGTRRSGACWTCKLRRKKCDEEKPACKACVSRSVTCHGYGDEPDWWNDETKEKEELDRIQLVVKHNKSQQRRLMLQSRRVRKQQLQSSQSGGSKNNAQDACDDRHCCATEQHSTTASPSVEETGSMDVVPTPDDGFTPASTLGSNDALHFRFSHYREAELLMHYLDHVFHLQFRFHVASVQSGGRGWLLWLLTQTKPLYHAALSLGALHQHRMMYRGEHGSRYQSTRNELYEHHSRALQELQLFMQSSYGKTDPNAMARKRKLQILASGVQLISFELFRGGIDTWQVHLDPLAAIVSSISIPQRVTTGRYRPYVAEATSGLLTPDLASEHDSNDLDTAEHFLIGAIAWFDVLSCASTGHAPRLLAIHDTLFGKGGCINLANIVGCQAWVALLIGEVAALQQWKDETSQASKISMWVQVEQGNKGNVIRQRLNAGITQLRADIDTDVAAIHDQGADISVYLIANPEQCADFTKRLVTLVFAHATQVYLNTTMFGHDAYLDEVQSSVADTAKALEDLKQKCDRQALRSLVWPICIAGSLAESTELQVFFRSLIEDLGEQAHDFGNSKEVLSVMKACWATRQKSAQTGEPKECSWKTVMASGHCILLV